jgi:hypothetical protein
MINPEFLLHAKYYAVTMVDQMPPVNLGPPQYCGDILEVPDLIWAEVRTLRHKSRVQ